MKGKRSASPTIPCPALPARLHQSVSKTCRAIKGRGLNRQIFRICAVVMLGNSLSHRVASSAQVFLMASLEDLYAPPAAAGTKPEAASAKMEFKCGPTDGRNLTNGELIARRAFAEDALDKEVAEPE
jgi:hypothetical protein